MKYQIREIWQNQHIPSVSNVVKGVVFLGLGILVLAFASYIVRNAPTIVAAVLFFPIGITLNFFMVAIGILVHESQHRLLCRSRKANDIVGWVLSSIMFLPFYANLRFHIAHHQNTHKKNIDPEDGLHQGSYWTAYALGAYRNFVLQYKELIDGLRSSNSEKRRDGVIDIIGIVLVGGFAGLLSMVFDLEWAYILSATILTLPITFSIRYATDHYGFPSGGVRFSEDEPPLKAWIVKTSPFVEWAWSHMNYHEIHHRYPILSHAVFREVYAKTKDRIPYKVLDGYVKSSLKLSKTSYYEENSSKIEDLTTVSP